MVCYKPASGSSLFKWRTMFRGKYGATVKIHWHLSKVFFFRSTEPINFNQTLLKASLVYMDMQFLLAFPFIVWGVGGIIQTVKINCQFKKISSYRTSRPIWTNLMSIWIKRIQIWSNKMPHPFWREDNNNILVEKHRKLSKSSLLRTSGQISTKLGS